MSVMLFAAWSASVAILYLVLSLLAPALAGIGMVLVVLLLVVPECLRRCAKQKARRRRR
jgi:hypothetical protein